MKKKDNRKKYKWTPCRQSSSFPLIEWHCLNTLVTYPTCDVVTLCPQLYPILYHLILLCRPRMNLSNHIMYVGLSVIINFFSSLASTEVFISSTDTCQHDEKTHILFRIDPHFKCFLLYIPELRYFFKISTATPIPDMSSKTIYPISGNGGVIPIFPASLIPDLISKKVLYTVLDFIAQNTSKFLRLIYLNTLSSLPPPSGSLNSIFLK